MVFGQRALIKHLFLLTKSGASLMSGVISFPVRMIFICMWGWVFFPGGGFFGGVINTGVEPVWSVSQCWAGSLPADGSWSCHPKSHSLISCLFSPSLAPSPATPSIICGVSSRNCACKGWRWLLEIPEELEVQTWGLPGRANSEILVALPFCWAGGSPGSWTGIPFSHVFRCF